MSSASPQNRTAIAALAAVALIGLAGAARAAPPFPLGAYTYDPDRTNAAFEQKFEAQFNGFTAAMGRPALMNSFIDYTRDPSQWPASASASAASWASSPVVGRTITPVIGVPMASTAGGWGQADTFFRAIAAGTYDADYAGIVDAWAAQGYSSLVLRIGYEMNGTALPWSAGNAATNQDWVAAFRHLAALMRAEAALDGASVSIVWNPLETNRTVAPVANLYPGDASVDVIAIDIYNTVSPLDLTDWKTGGEDGSLAQWMSVPANRRHYWSTPSADAAYPAGIASGAPALEYSGWSLTDTINLALVHGKPIAVPEAGAGRSGNGGVPDSISDDGVFPTWLAQQLGNAQAQGATVAFVSVWDASISGGSWDYTSGAVRRPNEKAAWQGAFGGVNP